MRPRFCEARTALSDTRSDTDGKDVAVIIRPRRLATSRHGACRYCGPLTTRQFLKLTPQCAAHLGSNHSLKPDYFVINKQ